MDGKHPSKEIEMKTQDVITQLENLGCVYDPKVKTFHKLQTPDGSKCVYLGKTKTLTRVDISGFIPPEHPAILPLTKEQAKEKRIGAVRGQIFPTKVPEGVDPAEALLMAVTEMLTGSQEGFKAVRGQAADPYAADVEEANAEEEQESDDSDVLEDDDQ